MKTVIFLLIAFVLGAIFGMGTMCCLVISGREDRKIENTKKAGTE